MGKEEKKSGSKYTVIEVPTQTAPMISDGEKVYTLEQALALLLEKIEHMEKKIVG